MWLSRRNSKLPRRAPQTLLFLEQLEKRELLNGSPLSSLPQKPLASTQGPALPGPVAAVPTPAWAVAGPQQKAPATSKAPLVQLPLVVGPDQSSSPVGQGYTPAQMQQAYGFNQITLPAGETFNDAGSGQTIAIIDGLNDPYIASDLQTFDTTFHIGGTANNPASTSFLKVVNEYGGSTLPATDNGQVDYGIETSLDVEWAHAMAPGANILLVEISTPFNYDDLNTAIEYAARQPGVSVISMSFGSGEWGTDYYSDNIFTTPAGHSGVSFIASAGDSSAAFQEYPGMSPNVLSVGGTTLPADTSGNPDRAQEFAWTEGGGGVSFTEAEPAYQLGVQSTGFRTGPDLAYDADASTGVAVYDTLFANANSPGEPWLEVGGTSMGAPQISSLVAITNQLRVAAGEGTLDGPNQLLPAIYQIAATDPKTFQDITSGNNGYPAGPGYDFATGLGTPNAQYLVPDLVAVDPKPAAPATLYWTGDVDTNWNTPGNWSTVDPLVNNVQQSILPTFNDNVVVDLSGATILHDATNYDTISSFTVTAPGVTLDLGAGTLDLAGSGGRGTFQVDQPGDAVTMEGGILANADVTSGTILSATNGPNYQQYPELAGVQLDGTLDVNQSGGTNGIVFTNGLILNGAINLGGTSDLSAWLLAGYADGNVGNQDNNPETISGSGTIQLGQSQDGDAIFNWGTVATFTIGPGITIRGGGPGSLALFEQTFDTGGLDNQGTIDANGGTFEIQAFGPVSAGPGSSTTTAWTNEGTIAATGATLELFGSWINYGTIRVDANSTLLLGDTTNGEVPSSPNAVFDTWSSLGSLIIGNGATVYVGGFLTTDQYQGTAAIPGVSVDPAADTFYLDGTLDNSAADNAVSGGVLTVDPATGSLQVVGGTINGGSIVTLGNADVEVSVAPPTLFFATGDWLDNVTNYGTVNTTDVTLTLQGVTNNGTILGTAAELAFQGTWANSGTISVDAASGLYLGSPASSDPNFPPTLADGSAYAWNLHTVGTITVADGATIGFGGLMTSDQLAAFPTLPGVRIDLAQDTVVLDAWLDNNPADNPVLGGVLALTSATGPVNLAGGFISGGTITSTGTGALNVVGFGGPLNLGDGVLNNVTNDGTIAVSSHLSLEGNVVSNGALTISGGSFFFLPGGSFTNNGTVSMSDGGGSFASSVTNNGTITLTQAGFSVDPGSTTTGLTNNSSITLSSGFVEVEGALTNSGTVSCSTNSTAEFYGNYDNSHGIISIDSTSSLVLGYSPILQQNFPTILDGKPYAFDPRKVGTLTIADGATFDIGGLLTTDQWNAFPSLPGVSIHLAKDRVYLAGWLDNSRADNPKSHGVLALTATTGPLYLNAGYIYQGIITTSGMNDLEASSLGELDDVELDGTLNVTGPFEFGNVFVVNNMKLNGTIEMPEGQGQLMVGYFDNAADTISGTGTISMGTAQTNVSVVVDMSNKSLTIGSGITIDAGAQFADLVSEVSQINVEGTVIDNTPTSIFNTYGQNQTTGALFQDLANDNAGTLTGGTWEFGNGATWRLDGGDLTTNAANLTVSGAGTQILDSIFSQGNNALAGLTTNTATGSFTLGAGYDFTAPGTFSNAGVVNIQSGAGFSTGSGNYSQSAGTTTVDGTLTAANVWLNGGNLNGTGTIVGNLTNAAIVTPGDAPGTLSIQGNYTQTAAGALDVNIAGSAAYGQLAVSGTATLAGALNVALKNCFTPTAGASFPILTFAARSGNFSTETGLTLSKNKFFVPSFDSNDLTLVLGPGVSVVAGADLDIIGGLTSNDQVQIKPVGSSNTGSTGVQVTATLNGVSTTTTFSQAFSAIDVFGFAGNDTIHLAATLTISATISAGDGNDNVTTGDGSNTITLGNGNDNVTAGNGSNTVTLGNGNDNVTAGNGDNTVNLGAGNDNTKIGNGNNVVVEGNGNDNITAGNGDNLIVAGLGQHTVHAGNGSNILIDGSVKLTQSGDSLQQVLDDWMRYGAQSANVASIRSRLAVTYNSSHSNTLDAGSGLDWFWVKYAKDSTNRKATDLLN
jgi:RTX calcium-binding nonapeptide repeat (4 copies)